MSDVECQCVQKSYQISDSQNSLEGFLHTNHTLVVSAISFCSGVMLMASYSC